MRNPNYAESVLLFLCTATTICFAFNLHDSEVMRCIEEERQALLKFRQGLLYSPELSWGTHEEDCCKWEGIKCSNGTGHVVILDLSHKHLSGEISSSLLGLQHLTVGRLKRYRVYTKSTLIYIIEHNSSPKA
jgi:EIX receptor 1/2